ncbi:MAG TPA: (d)CMP kinase [Candidatus Atribacteria bacterium]|jgi:cytidylate kinase|nr:MAG: Cytidylate kinase [Atribacteria bacterium 34_128]HAJ33369.1 (d)CMP kinase [Candidatus Atribacteria bacterium]
MKKNGLIIAIDGPAAVGKSTIGKLIARELGLLYIDTGAIYRAITWKVLKNNININDEEMISNLVSDTCITIERANNKSLNNYYHIFVDGEDVTEEIRNPRIDQNVSQIARLPKIRKQLIYLQKELAEKGNIVMEGRDIGSVILPQADIKFYFTASEEERIKRRYKELINKGYSVDYEEVKKQIMQRDEIDRKRKYAPLIKARDAILIDSTEKSIEEIKDKILKIIKKN